MVMELIDEVRLILAAADADIAARKPICQSSGRCCKFEQYGHNLFVTAAELLFFAQTVQNEPPTTNHDPRTTNPPNPVSLPQFFAQQKPEGCPYQINGLCTARDARPLGCRIYFCDENAQHWQATVYEKYHEQLKALHEKHALPYRYMEWRAALRELLPGAQPLQPRP